MGFQHLDIISVVVASNIRITFLVVCCKNVVIKKTKII